MKNKADLYKLSSPNRVQTKFTERVQFMALIGTYERSRTIIIEAFNVHDAITEASQFCKSTESVIQIIRDGTILWKHKYY